MEPAEKLGVLSDGITPPLHPGDTNRKTAIFDRTMHSDIMHWACHVSVTAIRHIQDRWAKGRQSRLRVRLDWNNHPTYTLQHAAAK